MNTSDIEPSAVVTTEKIKHICAAVGCAFIGLIFFYIVIKEIIINPDFKMGVMPTILLIGLLLIPVFIIIDMKLLRIEAAGNTIYVKNLNITQSFEFPVNEIKQITFRSQKYKSYVTYYTAITTADHSFEISNTQLGYKDMLIYLKDMYDKGVIPDSAISKFDYSSLTDHISYYS